MNNKKSIHKLLSNLKVKFEIQLTLSILALSTLVSASTIIYHKLEGWSWITSFYFSVTTLTTVGYGDFHPTNEASRLFTACYLIIGIAIALASFAIIGKTYLTIIEESLNRPKKEKRL